MDILINHPSVGSIWLSRCKIKDGFIVGDVWDTSQCGSGYYPDDYMGEWFTMSFPVSCIRKKVAK